MAVAHKISGAKKQRSAGHWKWLLIPLAILLLIPGLEVAAVRFVNPPRTLPMLIEQGGSVFSHSEQAPLRYHWIGLEEIPEMFLKHLWISEDQRFFQHDGFDWKEVDLAMKKAERTGKPVRGIDDHEPVRAVDLSLAGAIVDPEGAGVLLHDLDGSAAAEATHPRALRQRD